MDAVRFEPNGMGPALLHSTVAVDGDVTMRVIRYTFDQMLHLQIGGARSYSSVSLSSEGARALAHEILATLPAAEAAR